SSGSSNRPWSSRYYGSTYIVTRPHTYYRGGGSTLVHSPYTQLSNNGNKLYGESPTIITEMIRDTLFTGAEQHPSPAIFNTKDDKATNDNGMFKELFTDEKRRLEFLKLVSQLKSDEE
ncbi:hypothetical protein PFISCL1PPCAC_4645, partial [Pristionchus fissidentatus]